MEHLSRTHRLFKVRHWVPWPSVPVASHNIPGLGLAQPRSVGSVGLAAVRRLCSFGVSARCVGAVAELVPWYRGDLGGLSVWLMNPVEVKCFPWTLWYPEICLFTCLYCTPLSHNIPQQGQESLINSFSVFFLRWKQLRMKGGSWPVKQVHQRRGNPWINTGVTNQVSRNSLRRMQEAKHWTGEGMCFCGKWRALPAGAKSERVSWGERTPQASWASQGNLSIKNLWACSCTWQLYRVFGHLWAFCLQPTGIIQCYAWY